MRLRPPHSLRARLLWLLLGVIAITAVAQAIVSYRTARDEVDEVFDYHMRQAARSLASGLPDQSAAGGAEGDHDDNYDFVIQVWTRDGLPIFRSARIPIPRREAIGFSDMQVLGTTYRVFNLQSKDRVIQVAQEMTARREMARTLAMRTAGPIVLMAPLSMLLVWWVVRTSLAPVQRARRQVAERQVDDLGAVAEEGLPDEIRPLVHELNLLFGRVRVAFENQTRFVADAAHELRSPLAALKLQVHGLQRAPDERTRDLAAARLHSGIDRANRLVEQLLLLARQEARGAGGPQWHPVQLADMTRQAVADIAGSAQSRQIDIGMTRADSGTFLGDADAVGILLRNLLDNAVKYTPVGGTVDVEVRRDGGDLLLQVQDSGPGIEADHRERVLDRFYRLAGTHATGSGLGLSIVKSIAELHGAALTLDRSKRLGGLCVTVGFLAGA
jgi:two-component system OmpR family sensor kinase